MSVTKYVELTKYIEDELTKLATYLYVHEQYSIAGPIVAQSDDNLVIDGLGTIN